MKPEVHDDADKISELKEIKRPRGLDNVLDKQSLNILKALELDSFDHLQNVFDEFLEDTPLFQGDTSFSKAAMALDCAARIFTSIDFNHDHMIDHGELVYLLGKATDDNREALGWLVDHYKAFTDACFFKDHITRDDLEAARNVFHGLYVVHDKFGFSEEATPENLQHLDANQIRAYLEKHQDSMEPHDRAGLTQLLEYIHNHGAKTKA